MNYFDYVPKSDKDMGKVWGLFKGMTPEEIGRNPYGYSLEIVKSALSGSIDEAEFDLKRYTFGCVRNDKLNINKKRRKELFIVDSYEDEDEGRVNFGDISDRCLGSLDSMLDEVLSNESFNASVQALLGMRDEYIRTKGIDIVVVVRGAVKGVQAQCKMLKRLVCRDSKLAVVIEGLLVPERSEEILSRLSVVGV